MAVSFQECQQRRRQTLAALVEEITNVVFASNGLQPNCKLPDEADELERFCSVEWNEGWAFLRFFDYVQETPLSAAEIVDLDTGESFLPRISVSLGAASGRYGQEQSS